MSGFMGMPSGTSGGVGGETARLALLWRRYLALAVLVLGLLVFFAFDFDRYVTYEFLHDRRMWLARQVADHFVLSGLIFLGGYALAVAFSLPASMFLSIVGGLMFGEWLGTLYSVIGATIGATVLFVVAKSTVGDHLRARAGPWLAGFERGFREHALSYLLVLRMILIFPFWMINLVPAFLGVSLRIYVAGTFFGIIPGSFIYNLAGAGLGESLIAEHAIAAGEVFNGQFVGALAGLIVMVLLPVAYRAWKSRSGQRCRPSERARR